jgi:hypothetical protein
MFTIKNALRYLIQEMWGTNIRSRGEKYGCARNDHSVPAFDVEVGMAQIGHSQNEIRSDKVVRCPHGQDSSSHVSIQFAPSDTFFPYQSTYANHRRTRIPSPISLEQGLLPWIRPSATRHTLHISAIEYATVSEAKQIPIHGQIMTRRPPALTPAMKTPPRVVQLVRILKLNPIMPRRLKLRLSSACVSHLRLEKLSCGEAKSGCIKASQERHHRWRPLLEPFSRLKKNNYL